MGQSRTTITLAALLLGLALCSSTAFADLRLDRPERLSGKRTVEASKPVIATTPRGRSLVAWPFKRRSPRRMGIRVAVVKPNGAVKRRRTAFRSKVRTTESQLDVAIDPSGAGTIVWRVPEADRMHVLLVDRKGRRTAHLRLGEGILRGALARVVRDRAGVSTVVWMDLDRDVGANGAQRMFAARIAPDGSSAGRFRLSGDEEDLLATDQVADLAVARDGTVTAVWEAVDFAGGSNESGGWMARLAPDGTPTDPVRFDSEAGGVGESRVVTDPRGRATLAWTASDPDDETTVLDFRRLSAAGELGPVGRLVADGKVVIRSLAADRLGRVHASWLRTPPGQGLRPQRMLELRQVDADGDLSRVETVATERFVKGGELSDGVRPTIVWQRKREPRSAPRLKALDLRRDGTARGMRPVSLGRGDRFHGSLPRVDATRDGDRRIVFGRGRGERRVKVLLAEGSR